MNPVAADAASFTPPDLVFDADLHRYMHASRPMLSVTGALRESTLAESTWYRDTTARERGTRVHAHIERLHSPAYGLQLLRPSAEDEPFVHAYLAFQAECPLRVDAVEERVCDPALMCAGTLDLRGQFLDIDTPATRDRIDIVDIKTGSTPCWVGYQVAGYVRLLPFGVQRRCRRWCLTLLATGRYRLDALTSRSDDAVFMAALTIAQAKRGWL